eukprot:scaffold150960_cov33-Tisochrysis_lutea.AAC.2
MIILQTSISYYQPQGSKARQYYQLILALSFSFTPAHIHSSSQARTQDPRLMQGHVAWRVNARLVVAALTLNEQNNEPQPRGD